MTGSAIPLIVAILIVGIFVFVAMMLNGRRGGHKLDVEHYQTAWLKIENELNQNNPASFSLAVLDADKLLDEALRDLRVPGATLGERLKHSSDRFTNLNKIWAAHKLRNQTAHETGFHPSYKQARFALAVFKQALKDLGAI